MGHRQTVQPQIKERGVTSGAILFAYRNFIEKLNFKITPAAPKNESGLAQIIMMGESIRHLWVKILVSW